MSDIDDQFTKDFPPQGEAAPCDVNYPKPKERGNVALYFIAIVLIAPILSILVIAIFGAPSAFGYDGLLKILPRYALNSLVLLSLVAGLSVAIGTGAAYFVTQFEFRGRRFLELALFFPFAIPAYLSAYAHSAVFDFGGPIYNLLNILPFEGATSLLPRFTGMFAAVLVLSAAQYPYVYIFARSAFYTQPRSRMDSARVLGASPQKRFWQVTLPSIRPAILAGASLVALEALADFGTVEFFGVETLSTGIFTEWLQAYDARGAAQIAVIMVGAVVLLLGLEYWQRRRLRYFSRDVRQDQLREVISKKRTVVYWGLCLLPIAFGFLFPLAMLIHGIDFRGLNEAFWRAALHSFLLGGGLAVFITMTAIVIVRISRTKNDMMRTILQMSVTLGYATPGTMLGLGVLLPLAFLDHRIADIMDMVFGGRFGLILTGSVFALALALFIRYFALGFNTVTTEYNAMNPNLVAAGRSLGIGKWEVFQRVEAPLIRRGLLAGLVLIFVDIIKELPATLLLAPPSFETLATRAHQYAGLEDFAGIAPPALMIALLGIIPVLLLAQREK